MKPQEFASIKAASGLHADLTHCLTRYDRAQQNKRGYNVYALGQYLMRGAEVVQEVESGATLGDALRNAFNGPLLAYVAKAASVAL